MELMKGGMSVRAVAQELGYRSTRAFSRQFLLRIGSSPRQWLLRSGHGESVLAQIAEAERLLRAGKKLSMVAEMTGFSSYQEFALTFREIHGVSPREWRERQPKTKPVVRSGEHTRTRNVAIEVMPVPPIRRKRIPNDG